jgi:putative nucleotidyltransferase with HDIG domain
MERDSGGRGDTLIMNDSLKLHVEQITNLPSLPAIAQEIITLTDNDLISVNKLERIIGNDPAISAKILSVSNSVFYGFTMPVKTLNNAIMRIGFSSVRNIALGISIMTVLNDEKHQGTPDYARIFNHSVAVGVIARLLSRRFKLNITDEVVLSGILHDIGLLIISRCFPDGYLDVLKAFEKGKGLLDAEKDIFNFNHTDIGYWLAEKWNLPGTISDTILFHHNPSCAKENVVHVATVHIADFIADRNVIRPTSRDFISPFDPSSLALLGMSEDNLNDVIHEVKSGAFFNGFFKA